MRRLAVAVPVALLLSVMPALAMAQAAPPAGQAPGQPKPTPTAPAQPGQKPAPTAPAQPAPKPVQPPIAAQPPSPPKPFPQGAKVAFVNLQAVFQLSADGKAAATKVQSLTTQKQAQIAERQKVLQANQQKLQTGGTLMNEQARGQLEKDVEKQTRELERFQQDAQAELQDLQVELNDGFQKKLFPVLQKMAEEKGLQMLFSAADAGLIWADEGLNLTEEAVKRLDGGVK
jgi:Skp family chaperone for outer membrane proteins